MKKFVIFLLILFCFVLSSCDEEIEDIYFVYLLNDVTQECAIQSGKSGSIINEEAEELEGYTFDGWYNQDKQVSMPYTITNENVTLTAKYSIITFSITFKNDDGSIIDSFKVNYGELPPSPANPTKNENPKSSYTFKSWDKEIIKAYSDMTYTATYEETVKQYTYIFYHEDGKTILKKDTINYGELPVEPNQPTKESDDTYTYEFKGWDKAVSALTSDTSYIATFNAIKKTDKLTTLENAKFSILGDSISTFYKEGSLYNSYYSNDGTYYYPIYCSSVKSWDMTWWGNLLNNTKMQLGINNSWSGSRASGSGSNAGIRDERINTLDDNGTPDILLVYLGTNDCAGGVEPSIFKQAIITIVTKAKALGINQIYLTTLGYSDYTGNKYSDERRIEFNKGIREVAATYNCGVVPLDEYITDESFSFYLNDYLHYQAKGAALLSEIFEKSILEYNGLTYTKTITVEKKEKLPEGVLGKITATADSGFWTNQGYTSNVYFFDNHGSSVTNPTFSLRIEITKNTSDNQYYVTQINKSGVTCTFNCDYVLVISDANTNAKELKSSVDKVVVGCLVEFDLTMKFPMEITFKEMKSTDSENKEDESEKQLNDNPIIDSNGIIHVSNYNKNVFSTYETELFIYSSSASGIGSNSYKNFYAIGLIKDGENYKIVSMKNAGVLYTSLDETNNATYILFIYSSSAAKAFYENANINQYVKVTNDIESGDCTLELIK